MPRTKPIVAADARAPTSKRRELRESFTVDTGTATLVREQSGRQAYTLLLDGIESSYVDLDDPRLLAFEYVRWLGDVLDCLAPTGRPLDTLHLGGGAASLARYVMATRPASAQVVVEIDEALVDLVRTKLPWRATKKLRFRVGDARTVLDKTRPSAFDVVVRDAFLNGAPPTSLRTLECAQRVREVVRPGGVYLLNIADRSPFAATGVELAALLEVFSEVAVISEPSVLRGRRHGNLVIAASDASLPIEAISRRVADGGVQGRVRDRQEATAMSRGHRALRDATGGSTS
ncbi:MAG TPA: fused MFS/spermidine synthase [Acidothermaceae bacterium]